MIRFRQKEYGLVGDLWQGVKNNVRWFFRSNGERNAIERGEDPKKVKGLWNNIRPRWSNVKDSLLGFFRPTSPLAWYRRHKLMQQHDALYKDPKGIALREAIEGRERGYSWRFYSIPSQRKLPQMTMPTAKEVQKQNFQMQKQLMQNQRLQQKLQASEREAKLRAQRLAVDQAKMADKAESSAAQGVKNSRQLSQMSNGPKNIGMYNQKTQQVMPIGMKNF